MHACMGSKEQWTMYMATSNNMAGHTSSSMFIVIIMECSAYMLKQLVEQQKESDDPVSQVYS